MLFIAFLIPIPLPGLAAHAPVVSAVTKAKE
jgi:hypothetical protein